jgi:23S rRNA (cytidine1920-2'-O)/16S rRNA (cytidine1409-2'-O)-methyltransferase
MANRIRIDKALRLWGLAPSRAKAQELLSEGVVEMRNGAEWAPVTSDATLVDQDGREGVRLADDSALEFVSRGGRKLAAALSELKINVEKLRVLDVGISTGGFTDCLLSRGVSHVVGVDVGHDQLAEKLKNEPRLQLYEDVNARYLRDFAPLKNAKFDLIVVDVSFVSLRLILPEVVHFLKPNGQLLALVKPQFEVGAEHLNRRGVVTDLDLHEQLRGKMESFVTTLNLKVMDFVASRLPGQEGNQEYFLYACLSS